VEGGRGKNGQVILTSTEQLPLPSGRGDFGRQLRVAEYFLEFGVVKGAVDGGVGIPFRRG